MNDEFIRSVQADWRTQGNDIDEIVKRLRRNRWTPHVVLGLEILVCVSAFLAGLWFAWVAVHHEQDRLLYVLSAGVMLLTAPALCVAGVMARRASLAWDVETPESLLNVGIRRAESSLRAIRIGRWHVAIIAAFVVTLWVAETLGFVHAVDFLIFYTLICLAVSFAGWLWMGWHEKSVRSEHAACVRLLAALRVDNETDA
jgi:hypothetical protein